jgi:DNA-binding GntR family transcriptional regulator
MRATSNRKLAQALGVSETAVRKALAAGRISRDADGGFDIARVKRQWAGNTDAAQQRPARKAAVKAQLAELKRMLARGETLLAARFAACTRSRAWAGAAPVRPTSRWLRSWANSGGAC